MAETIHHIKTLRQRDLVLFTVSAILLLDTLTADEIRDLLAYLERVR